MSAVNRGITHSYRAKSQPRGKCPEWRLKGLFDSFKTACILDITPEAFRQRLSRGRKQIQNFMSKKCSLIHPKNPCACSKLIPLEIKINFLDPGNLRFANHRCYARRKLSVDSRLQELNAVKRLAVLFRSHPDYAAPGTFVESVKKLVESGQFEIFSN
jgi:hypothetical protein